MNETMKRFVSSVNPVEGSSGCRVLLYHAIDVPVAEDTMFLRVPPQEFRAQLEWLRHEGYRVIPLGRLPDAVEDGTIDRTIAITFDDGLRSQLEAGRLLKAFGFPATFFVVPRFLDGECDGPDYWERWDHFDWSDVRWLSGEGFEIGAHSASHARLTSCTPDQLQEEIAGARSRLTARLGQDVRSFSYPHGAFNRAVVCAVEQAGYRVACTSVYGAVRRPWSWLLLRRIEIMGNDRLHDFRQKVVGKYDWLASWQRWQAAHA